VCKKQPLADKQEEKSMKKLFLAALLALSFAGVLCPVAFVSPAWAEGQASTTQLTSFSKPQEYSGEIEFKGSKKVVITFSLSADAKQITEMKLSTEKLILTPKSSINKKSKPEKKESIFKFSKKSSVRTNMKITTSNGYNVMALDASGNPVIDNIVFTGGFESTSPIDVNNGKISLDVAPLISDLTVTNTNISGNVKVELQGCETKSVHAVFKNVTKE
jgi:hypothetical protein